MDYHSCDFFPERWFDLVVVLTADNGVLYDRLAARGYAPAKVSANVECEIMRVCADEAADAYEEDIVKVLPSNTVEDMEANVDWVAGWARDVSANAAATTAVG
jgi:broad-specificity NMP kinase